jgi:hypothetical protein
VEISFFDRQRAVFCSVCRQFMEDESEGCNGARAQRYAWAIQEKARTRIL